MLKPHCESFECLKELRCYSESLEVMNSRDVKRSVLNKIIFQGNGAYIGGGEEVRRIDAI